MIVCAALLIDTAPEEAVTLNLSVLTAKSPVDESVVSAVIEPLTVTEFNASLTRSASVVGPISSVVNRTDSTSTYPCVLVIASPFVAPPCPCA